MNSTFRARWLASSEVISQVLFTSEQPKENKIAFTSRSIITNKVTLWAASYSACVVYTKTIIHLSVSESGGYLPPLWWIIANYFLDRCFKKFFFGPLATNGPHELILIWG